MFPHPASTFVLVTGGEFRCDYCLGHVRLGGLIASRVKLYAVVWSQVKLVVSGYEPILLYFLGFSTTLCVLTRKHPAHALHQQAHYRLGPLLTTNYFTR